MASGWAFHRLDEMVESELFTVTKYDLHLIEQSSRYFSSSFPKVISLSQAQGEEKGTAKWKWFHFPLFTLICTFTFSELTEYDYGLSNSRRWNYFNPYVLFPPLINIFVNNISHCCARCSLSNLIPLGHTSYIHNAHGLNNRNLPNNLTLQHHNGIGVMYGQDQGSVSTFTLNLAISFPHCAAVSCMWEHLSEILPSILSFLYSLRLRIHNNYNFHWTEGPSQVNAVNRSRFRAEKGIHYVIC